MAVQIVSGRSIIGGNSPAHQYCPQNLLYAHYYYYYAPTTTTNIAHYYYQNYYMLTTVTETTILPRLQYPNTSMYCSVL